MSFLIRMMMLMIMMTMMMLLMIMMMMTMMLTPIMTTWMMDEYRSKAPVSGRAPRHTRRKPQVTGGEALQPALCYFSQGTGGETGYTSSLPLQCTALHLGGVYTT